MDTVSSWFKENDAFYRSQALRPVSAKAQVLWHYLMYRANGAFWQFPLRLSEHELSGGTQLSLSSVKRARGELALAGYLCYEPGDRGHAAAYRLKSCVNPGQDMRGRGPAHCLPPQQLHGLSYEEVAAACGRL